MFDQRLCIAYSALDRATALLGKEEKRFRNRGMHGGV